MEAGVESLARLHGEAGDDDLFFPPEDFDEIRAHAMQQGGAEGSDDEGDDGAGAGADQVNAHPTEYL
jgi:hypothetical protein